MKNVNIESRLPIPLWFMIERFSLAIGAYDSDSDSDSDSDASENQALEHASSFKEYPW